MREGGVLESEFFPFHCKVEVRENHYPWMLLKHRQFDHVRIAAVTLNFVDLDSVHGLETGLLLYSSEPPS